MHPNTTMTKKKQTTAERVCRNCGPLPLEKFHPSSIKHGRTFCKSCFTTQQKASRSDHKMYMRAAALVRSVKKAHSSIGNHIYQSGVYRAMLKSGGKCAFTGKKRNLMITRWRSSQWEHDDEWIVCVNNVYFMIDAARTVLDAGKPVAEAVTSVRSQLARDESLKHLVAPWILDDNINVPDCVKEQPDVPALVFSEDTIEKIGRVIDADIIE